MLVRKQRHLMLFPNHAKMLAAFEGRNQSSGYATVRYWAGGLRTPTYTTCETLSCGTQKETLYKHEKENWQQDVSGMEFYGLTIFADTSAEGVRWHCHECEDCGMSRYKELQIQQRAIAARLKGAILYQHKYRGMVYQLVDGTFLSQTEYKVLRRQCMFYMMFAI